MVGTTRQLLGRVRGRATGNTAMGVYGLAVALMALFLTYSVLTAITLTVPLLSTTTIIFIGIVVWLVTWALLDVLTSYIRERQAT